MFGYAVAKALEYRVRGGKSEKYSSYEEGIRDDKP
jgi:hypothetical protein